MIGYDMEASSLPLLNITITYLQMLEPPPAPPTLPADALIMHAVKPTVSFYRYLYNTIGEPWLWFERRRISDDALAKLICVSSIEVYVLYIDGVPAGYGELDVSHAAETKLVYFGLLPEFIGRGYGKRFLQHLCHLAWREHTERVWVHTCNLDHPRALSVYQSVGFVAYDQHEHRIIDPRTTSSM